MQENRAIQFQKNSDILKKYIPEQAVETIAKWVVEFDFKLKITKERKTKLGDYTSPRDGFNHVITVNHNLNKYAFLVTLVHEVAHLITFNHYKNRVAPHGAEWKQNFKQLMHPFLSTDIFPLDVLAALNSYLRNPAASSCTDVFLYKVLSNYNSDSDTLFLEYLPYNTEFIYDRRVFIKKELIKKRFKCIEVSSQQTYLFHAIAEVMVFEKKTNAQSNLF